MMNAGFVDEVRVSLRRLLQWTPASAIRAIRGSPNPQRPPPLNHLLLSGCEIERRQISQGLQLSCAQEIAGCKKDLLLVFAHDLRPLVRRTKKVGVVERYHNDLSF